MGRLTSDLSDDVILEVVGGLWWRVAKRAKYLGGT